MQCCSMRRRPDSRKSSYRYRRRSRPSPRAGASLRRLPDRFARHGRRIGGTEIAAGARPRDCRHRCGTGRNRVERFALGERVGIPWLGWTCGVCPYCNSGRENLCDGPRFTGYQIDGGYGEYTVADQLFVSLCPPLIPTRKPPRYCAAGLIGYRSLVMAGDRAHAWGFLGSAAAHIIAQVARHQAAGSLPSPVLAMRRHSSLPAIWCGVGRGFRRHASG